MDHLLSEFSLLFRNSDSKSFEELQKFRPVLLQLRDEYPEVFIYALLEFVKVYENREDCVFAAACLKKFICEEINDFKPEPTFLCNLFEIFLSIEAEIAMELLKIISFFIKKSPDSHQTIYDLIERILPEAKSECRLRILSILRKLYQFSSPKQLSSFNLKNSELLCAWFSDSCRLERDHLSQSLFVPFYDLLSLVQCLRFSISKGAFFPFHAQYHIWDRHFKSLLLDELKPSCNIFPSKFSPAEYERGFYEAREKIFDLQSMILMVLPKDDPFKVEYIQRYGKRMLFCLFNFLGVHPPMLFAISAYRFIFASLAFPSMYFKKAEWVFYSHCTPSGTAYETQSEEFDTNLLRELKNWLLVDRHFFMNSSLNFWDGKNELFYDTGTEPVRYSLRDKALILLKEDSNYGVYDWAETDSRTVRELQGLSLALAATNNIIPGEDILEYLNGLRNSDDDVYIEKSLYLLGFLIDFSNKISIFLNFFDINYLVTFTQSPYSTHIKTIAICCLFEFYRSSRGKFDCSKELLMAVSLNIFGDDILLSYCSIRLMEGIKRNSSNPERATLFISECLGKLIERIFTVVNAVSLFRPLIFIIECLDEKKIDEISIFAALFCDLGHNIISSEQEAPGQHFSAFLDICVSFLSRFQDNFSPLDSFFDDFFYFFIYIDLELMEDNPLFQITRFENFINRVISYILSNKKRYLETAVFLDAYLSEEFNKIDKEQMKSIRNIIGSCEDQLVKSKFSLFYSISEA